MAQLRFEKLLDSKLFLLVASRLDSVIPVGEDPTVRTFLHARRSVLSLFFIGPRSSRNPARANSRAAVPPSRLSGQSA
jgi:hypothetical protein